MKDFDNTHRNMYTFLEKQMNQDNKHESTNSIIQWEETDQKNSAYTCTNSNKSSLKEQTRELQLHFQQQLKLLLQQERERERSQQELISQETLAENYNWRALKIIKKYIASHGWS